LGVDLVTGTTERQQGDPAVVRGFSARHPLRVTGTQTVFGHALGTPTGTSVSVYACASTPNPARTHRGRAQNQGTGRLRCRPGAAEERPDHPLRGRAGVLGRRTRRE